MNEELRVMAMNLKTYMDKYNYTQTSLGKAVGVIPQTVSKWCRGVSVPGWNHIDKMCELFHCNRTQLLEEVQTDETIRKAEALKRFMVYYEQLNADGIEKLTEYVKDLNARYFKDGGINVQP